jgi:protein ImuB
VFVTREGGAMRVVAQDARALDMGLISGLTLADARARVPSLVAVASQPARLESLLRGFARWSERYTPMVALDFPDGLMLDVTGCAHLFGAGEEAEPRLRAAVIADFKRFGVTMRAALADTPDAARALTRFGADGVDVRDLPVAALEAGEEIETALKRAGLRAIGDLLDRPSSTLAARFGMALTTKLARLAGQEDRRISPLRPPPDVMAHRLFAEPLLVLAGLEWALAPLLHEICGALRMRGHGGRAFEFLFFRTDGAVRVIHVETAAPTHDAENILRLFRLRQESLADPLDPGFGFDEIRVHVRLSQPLADCQSSLDGSTDDDETILALAERLAARFGESRVRAFHARDAHWPERASTTVPFGARSLDASWPDRGEGAAPTRPLRLFDPPEPVEVIAATPDEPPVSFKWRRVWRKVARAEGPERIAAEWWRKDAAASPDGAPARDYYRLEDEQGRRYWLFREGLYETGTTPRWRLHGVFA